MVSMAHLHGETPASEALPAVRLDLWLWAARFFKTRSLAKQAIETGKVEIGGQRAKPSRSVHAGDALAIVRGEETFRVEVLGLSDVRGPRSRKPYIANQKNRKPCAKPNAPRRARRGRVTSRRKPNPTSERGA